MKRRSASSSASPSTEDRNEVLGLTNEIAGLGGLDVDGLRSKWRARLGRAAPAHLPKHLLVRILAYRLQAEVHADLDRESAKILSKIAAHLENKRSGRGSGVEQTRSIVGSVEANPALKPGTMLAREHGGVMHRVMVLRDGFACNGATYRSLSDVALAITGTKWNGPRFFGLRDQKRARVLTEAISPEAGLVKRADDQRRRTRKGALL